MIRGLAILTAIALEGQDTEPFTFQFLVRSMMLVGGFQLGCLDGDGEHRSGTGLGVGRTLGGKMQMQMQLSVRRISGRTGRL